MSDIPTICIPKETSVYRIVTEEPSNWHLVANRTIDQGEFLTLPGHSSLVNVKECTVADIVLEETHESKRIYLPLYAVPGDASCSHTLLETPWCFMNHSCAPSTMDQWSDEDPERLECAETVATRPLAEGEELTCDYVLEYYDYSPGFTCHCGDAHCRGRIQGFNGLSPQEKNRVFPSATPFIQSKHVQTLKKDAIK